MVAGADTDWRHNCGKFKRHPGIPVDAATNHIVSEASSFEEGTSRASSVANVSEADPFPVLARVYACKRVASCSFAELA